MKHLLKFANRVASDLRSDRELLATFASTRDSDTLAELFRRHAPTVRGIATDVCPAAADEVVQAAFLLLAERASTLAARPSAAGWLFQVARRLALKARTASARRDRHEARVPSPEPPPGPLDDLAFREVRTLVAEELANLPDRLRAPLVLHYWEGTAHAEAATRLGCSVSTLKRLLDTGRERLGTRLARRGLTGASVLTVLTALHTQAGARSLLGVRFGTGRGAGVSLSAALLRGAGGVGVAKTLAVTACVLLTGIALVLGLSAQDEPRQPLDAVAVDEKPPLLMNGSGALPEGARAELPAGAIAQLGADKFHHGALISRVFVTPDGRHAISIGSSFIMSVRNIKTKLWELSTGKELPLARGKLPSVLGGVEVATAVPIGKMLVLVVVPVDRDKGGGGGPWLIDAVSGETLAEIPQNGYADQLAVHPNGKSVAIANVRGANPAAADRRHEIFLWDLEKKKKPVALLQPQKRDIKRLQFSPDGRYLAVQYVGGAGVELVDVASTKIALTLSDTDTDNGPYDAFAFTPNGKLFVKEDRSKKSLRIWALADGKEQPAIAREDGNWGQPLAFDATGSRLGHLSARGTFCLFDLATGKPVWTARCRGGFLAGFDAAFTPDGARLVTAEHEDLVMRDAKTGKALDTTNHTNNILHLVWSGDGKRVATWDRDHGTPGRVWDASTGKPVMTIAGHADGCAALAASPDGSVYATSGARYSKDSGDTTVRLWSTADGREIAAFQPKLVGTDLGVRHLWFTPDGKTLFGAARERIYVWDVAKQKELRSFAQPFNYVNGAHLLAGGDRVLLSGWPPPANGAAHISVDAPIFVATIDLKTEKVIGPRIEYGQDQLLSVSPDGRFGLRTWYGSPSDHRAEVWDLTTGRTAWRLPGSNGKDASPWVTSGAFSQNHRTLSVGRSDGSVRVFECATRTERLRFEHGTSVEKLVYSPDGTRLASAGSRWGLVWDLATPQAAKPSSDADAWAGLANNDGRIGLVAIRYFVDRPTDAVRYFKDRVRPAAAIDPKQVAAWVEQVGSEDFTVRENASKQLVGVAESVREQLTTAVTKTNSPEVRTRLNQILATLGDGKPLTGDLLRSVRAIEALEGIRSATARELLKSLAGGAESRLTHTAAGALKRLEAEK